MNRKTVLTSIGGVVGLGILWAVGSWLLVGRYHHGGGQDRRLCPQD